MFRKYPITLLLCYTIINIAIWLKVAVYSRGIIFFRHILFEAIQLNFRGFIIKIVPGSFDIVMDVHIRHTNLKDYPALINLYRLVANRSGGIIRIDREINFDYVNLFIENSMKKGLSLVAEVDSSIEAEIHAYTPEIYAFRHMLSDLTIVVHPEYQNQGIGKKLFTEFLLIIQNDFPHILRIELYVREENKPIVDFYKSLGFINEGRQQNKILNARNELETPLHMAWFNPRYKSRTT